MQFDYESAVWHLGKTLCGIDVHKNFNHGEVLKRRGYFEGVAEMLHLFDSRVTWRLDMTEYGEHCIWLNEAGKWFLAEDIIENSSCLWNAYSRFVGEN